MAAPKRDELMILEDRTRIAALLHEGMNVSDITVEINRGRPEHLQVSRQAIQNDIKALEKQWKEAALYDFDAARNRVLDEILHLKKTYWEEYKKSKNPKVTKTTEAKVDEEDLEAMLEGGSTQVTRTITREERGTGNPAFLVGIERLIERECRILGIDAPNKVALTNVKGDQEASSVRDSIAALMNKMNSDITGVEEGEESNE